ncbi:MAG TPA: helix-turn-helix domain-containing protein [Roseiflexaceae bacterium]|nr:helix-turn-helix domain-containing protein [Roseiflexaceae bacterium]
MTDAQEYLDGDAAAALLGVKKATLYAYVSRGLLQSYKQGVGRKRLYRRADIEALCAVRPDAAEAEPPAPDTPSDDRVLRDVALPEAASWAGDH